MEIPILTYHSIDESGSVISTAPETFRRQMKFLRDHNFRVVSLKKLVETLNSDCEFLPKTVALTFDDGFRNFYTEVFPVLAEYRFPATVFLVTEHCGKFNDWAGNPPELPRSRLLSWREIREIGDRSEIDFGAHTRTHPDLTKISNARAESEIAGSKAAIEDALGREVTDFAYPFGKINESVKRSVEKNYRSGCSVKMGKVSRTSDFFSLARIDAYYLSNPRIFDSLNSRTFDQYIKFRQMLRDFKSLMRRN